jgi:hypothetical protein
VESFSYIYRVINDKDMTRFEMIKKEFSGVCGSLNLYVDGTSFFFVDVDGDRLEGYRHVTASCGCCSEVEDYDGSLSYEVEYMDDMDFSDLVEALTKLV